MSGVTILPKFRRPWFFFLCVVAFGAAYYAVDIYRLERGPYSESIARMASEAEILRTGSPDEQTRLLPIDNLIPFLFFLLFRVPSVAMAVLASPIVVYTLFSVAQGVRALSIRLILMIAVLTVPFVIAAGQFEHELYPLFFAFALSNYFLLEFYRRDYAFYLFGFGLSFALMYLVRPEIAFFALPICIGFLAIFGPSRQTATYLFVALFPLLFAMATRFAVQLIFSHDAASSLLAVWSFKDIGVRMAIGARISIPYALFLAIIVLREGRYVEFYRSPIFLALLSPLVFVTAFALLSTNVPVQACAALYIMNLALVYPYLAAVVPEKRLRLPLSVILILSIGLNAYITAYHFLN